MSKGATKNWVFATFEGVDANKENYKQLVKEIKPLLKPGRAVKAFKPAIDSSYKEAQKFAKKKNWEEAVHSLKLTQDAIRNALNARAPVVSRDQKRQVELGEKLVNIHSGIKRDQLQLPTLDVEAEFKAIGKMIREDDLDNAQDRLDALEDEDKLARAPLTAISDGLKQLLQTAGTKHIGVDQAKAKEVATLVGQANAVEAKKKFLALKKTVVELEGVQEALARLVMNANDKTLVPKPPADLKTDPQAILLLVTQGDLKAARAKLIQLKRALEETEDALPTDQKVKNRAKAQKTKMERRDARLKKMPVNPLLYHEYEKLDQEKPEDRRKGVEIYAKMLQENGAEFRANGAQGVNPSYWLESSDTDGMTKSKYLFKEYSGEKKLPGFPKGSSSCREDLVHGLSDKLGSLTGLDFGVPETQLVEVTIKGNKQIGSLQHHGRTRGEGNPRGLRGEPKDFMDKIPAKECQKIAVLDLVSLAMDRHDDNLMVLGDGADTKVIPIDHGLTLPSKSGMEQRIARLGLHALAGAKGSEDPLDPALVKDLDENAIEKELRDSYAAMKKADPEAATDEMFGDENIELVKRSVQFLKKAAAAGLSPADLYAAYMINRDEIFESSDKEKDDKFEEAIKAAKARKAALATLNDLFKTEGSKLYQFAAGNQWVDRMTTGTFGFQAWAKFYPDKFAIAYQKKVAGPLGTVDTPDSDAKGDVDEKTVDTSEYRRAFDTPKDAPITAANWDLWLEYKKLGGNGKLLRLGGNIGLQGGGGYVCTGIPSYNLRLLKVVILLDDAIRKVS